MKGLLTLIKLNKRSLDELRRKMVSLESQKAGLQALSVRLKEELVSEIQLASKNPEMGHFFGDFAKRMQQRQIEIAEEIAGLDKQMKELNDKIVEAFAELKKYEIALENARQREKERLDRRDNLAMDEIAEQQHRRKTEDASD